MLQDRRHKRGEGDQRNRPVVTIVYRSLPAYRLEFYEGLRSELDRRGIDLQLLVGDPIGRDAKKRDAGSVAWQTKIRNRELALGGRSIIWQPVLRRVRGSDLVILEQASRLLVNYPLLAAQRLGGPRIALWGHGVNLQGHTASSIGERVKRLVSRWPHWWFAYTDGVAGIVRNLGYPADRITSVQNAIDSRALRRTYGQLGADDVEAVRRELNIRGSEVAIFCGSIYDDKRPDFLIEAADAARALSSEFELIVIGSGPSDGLVREAAESRPWLHHLDSIFGLERARYFKVARAFALPGLVGLAVIDAFALETPLVAVDLPFHSPEIEYLEPEVNGVLLPEATTPAEYGAALVRLMNDGPRLERLVAGCRASADRYTVEEMVTRFADGIESALK